MRGFFFLAKVLDSVHMIEAMQCRLIVLELELSWKRSCGRIADAFCVTDMPSSLFYSFRMQSSTILYAFKQKWQATAVDGYRDWWLRRQSTARTVGRKYFQVGLFFFNEGPFNL